MTSPSTFPALLARLVAEDGSRPLVTFYDDATGERTELSVTTYANWVTKTANLLVEEYLLEEGDTVLVDLPTHWLTAVFLGAVWQAGLAFTTDPRESAHLVATAADGASWESTPECAVPPRYADRDVHVLATGLGPFAAALAEPLPDGVDDFGRLWPGQPDAWLGGTPVPSSVACRHPEGTHTQADVLARSADAEWPGDRLLTDVPVTDSCGSVFCSALARGGSVVLVNAADPDSWDQRAQVEHATGVLRVG